MFKLEKKNRTHLTEAQRAYVVGLHDGGLSIRSIAKKTGLSKSTVHDTINRVRKNLAADVLEPFKSRPRSGRPPLLERAARKLVRHATAHRFDSLQMRATPSKSGGTPTSF